MGSPLHGRNGRPRVQEEAIEVAVRKMVARELHDRVAQTLTGMLVDVENFKSEPVGWDDVLLELDSIQSSTRKVLSSLRQLLHDLRGEEQLGGSFIDALCALVVRFEEQNAIRAELEVRGGWPVVFAPAPSLNLYRIVEEALANVRNHSGASAVRVILDSRPDDQLVLTINDDGRGHDTSDARPSGLGTLGMKERALLLDGSIRIESEEGAGTTVSVVFRRAHVVPPAAEATQVVPPTAAPKQVPAATPAARVVPAAAAAAQVVPLAATPTTQQDEFLLSRSATA